MVPALILAGAIVLLGLVCWLARPRRRDDAPEPGLQAAEEVPEDGECCGLHITCEKDSLIAGAFDDVDRYFDDEELDAFAGREPGSYSVAECDAFRDVLTTLLPGEIAPWARALQLRGIALPAEVREELIMMVAEAREAK